MDGRMLLVEALKNLWLLSSVLRSWRDKRAGQKDASISDRGDMPGAESKETESQFHLSAGTFVENLMSTV